MLVRCCLVSFGEIASELTLTPLFASAAAFEGFYALSESVSICPVPPSVSCPYLTLFAASIFYLSPLKPLFSSVIHLSFVFSLCLLFHHPSEPTATPLSICPHPLYISAFSPPPFFLPPPSRVRFTPSSLRLRWRPRPVSLSSAFS